MLRAKGFHFYVTDHPRLLYSPLSNDQFQTEGAIPVSGALYCISSDTSWHILNISCSRVSLPPPSPARCNSCDQRCFRESMRFICSSFALSVSVIRASLLNTRGALSWAAAQGSIICFTLEGRSTLIKDQSCCVVKPTWICSKWLSYQIRFLLTDWIIFGFIFSPGYKLFSMSWIFHN